MIPNDSEKLEFDQYNNVGVIGLEYGMLNRQVELNESDEISVENHALTNEIRTANVNGTNAIDLLAQHENQFHVQLDEISNRLTSINELQQIIHTESEQKLSEYVGNLTHCGSR